MTFAEFEDRAARDWDRIPDEFKAGVDALVVHRDARAHAHASDVYTLGECITESYPSDFSGPETVRSELVLYYGSFRRLAAGDPDFDWENEIWETLTHELRHHLESLASEDDLEDIDAAMEENFKRLDGQPYDPAFYRAGEDLGDGWFRLERTLFLEITGPRDHEFHFDWDGQPYTMTLPASDADVVFVEVEGLRPLRDGSPDRLIVVSVRVRSLAARVRALLLGHEVSVAELVARAVPT